MVVETIAPGIGGYLSRSLDQRIPVATLVSGGMVAVGGAYLDPPDSVQLVPGTFALGTSSRSYRVLGLCNSAREGQLRIDDIAYEGSAVPRLVASFGMRCAASSTVSYWVSGTVSIGAPTPAAAVVRPAPVIAPSVGQAHPSTVSTTLTNTGDAPTAVLGAAVVDPVWPAAGDFSVASDGCVGQVLAPTDSCAIQVRFLRATGGLSLGWAKVPDASAPGGFVVAPLAGTAIGTPYPPAEVRPMPVIGGVGVAWSAGGSGFAPTGFEVERRVGDTWADVSGPLDAQARSWVDQTVAPGQGATYRVTAVNEGGSSAPSAEVTSTRPPQDAVPGSVDALSLDADYGAGEPVPNGTDFVVTAGLEETTARSTEGRIFRRSLAGPGPGPSVGLPLFIPGPGTYPVGPGPSGINDGLSLPLVSLGWCGSPTGSLTVDEVAYTPSRELAVLTAHYLVACTDGAPFYGELRWHSTSPLSAVQLSPTRADAGSVPVGEAAPPTRVEVVNAGTADQGLGTPVFTGPSAAEWKVVSSDCPDPLPAGERCGIDVSVSPTRGGARVATLEVPDDTLRGAHHAALTANGTSLPGAPQQVKALAVPQAGTDLSWDLPEDTGGAWVTGYVVRRTLGDDVQTTAVGPTYWTDPARAAGVTYQVAAVTTIGQGPWSAPVTPEQRSDFIYLNSAPDFGVGWKPSFIAVPDGTQPVITRPRSELSSTLWGAAVSPDGRQLLTSRNAATGKTGWVLVREAVDGSGTPTVLLDIADGRPGTPAWSPDGSRVAVSSHPDNGGPVLHVLDATTGAAVQTISGLDYPAWHPDSSSLFAVDMSENARPIVRISATTGVRLDPVTGVWVNPTSGVRPGTFAGVENASALATSPDGRWLAARIVDTTARSQVGLIPLAGGAVRWMPSSGGTTTVSWSPDGGRLLTTQLPWMGQDGVALSTVSESGELSAPDYVPLRPMIVPGLATWVGPSVAIGPTPTVLGPATTVPIDLSALPAGTVLTCSIDAAAFVPCTTAYRPAAASGSHLLRVRATEPSGRVSVAARTFTLDVTAPVVTITGPTALATGSSSVAVSYGGVDSAGMASYDVRYRYATYAGTFGPFRTVAATTTAGAVNVRLAAGYQYCFSVRGRDRLGNLSAWTAERCVSTMLDDRSLTRSSSAWARATGSSYFGSTVSTTKTAGVALTRPGVRARQVFVVATTCPTCGSVAIYVGSSKVGTLSLRSTTTRRVVLSTPLTSARSGTLKIVTTTSGRTVAIDAFAVRSW